MPAKETGGTAFPFPAYTYPNGELNNGEGGMTLRDYFAAKALPCAMEQSIVTQFIDGEFVDRTLQILAAKIAYSMADAMLEARNAAT